MKNNWFENQKQTIFSVISVVEVKNYEKSSFIWFLDKTLQLFFDMITKCALNLLLFFLSNFCPRARGTYKYKILNTIVIVCGSKPFAVLYSSRYLFRAKYLHENRNYIVFPVNNFKILNEICYFRVHIAVILHR